MDRIRTALVASGHQERFGEPLSERELTAQAAVVGMELPPSYLAAMAVASRIGEPETFLSSREMAVEARQIVKHAGAEAHRYVPFARVHDRLVCFDRGGRDTMPDIGFELGEMAIVEWDEATATPSPLAVHFGEWIATVADEREDIAENAARLPAGLKQLLHQLGFRFDAPVVGRVDTGDAKAVEQLIGQSLARTIRGDADRLFDSSGKAELTLNVDDFSLAIVLRTGTYVFEAEDVFRWFRHFRDENFFAADPGARHEPSHADNVRDLRIAPREAPLVVGGVVRVSTHPAARCTFHGASGASTTDFYLLGQRPGDRGITSVVLHIVDGIVATSHEIDEPLDDLYVARDGTIWALSTNHVVRVTGGRSARFPIRANARGRESRWCGIGGGGDRVLVWGLGALLEFDGSAFVPFEPNPMLEPDETVVALVTHGLRISMLVCGEGMGAVARFDSVQWQPISEDELIDGDLIDIEVWRGSTYVLSLDGAIHKSEEGHASLLALPTEAPAFLNDGYPRALSGLRVYDGGVLLASPGGVLTTGAGEPAFHALCKADEYVRLIRVGSRNSLGTPGTSNAPAANVPAESGIVAVGGSNAAVFRDNAFVALDMREW